MIAKTLKNTNINNIYPRILPTGFKERRQNLHLAKNGGICITANQLKTGHCSFEILSL